MENFYNFLKILDQIKPILQAISDFGGKSYLVGGSVRDLFLNLPIKDLDIEIHGIKISDLEKILKKFGHVKLVGKKFGVLRLMQYDIDWSLPRVDSKGRKPEVKIDPFLTIEQACKRRDLTMNAMAIDLNEILISSWFDFAYRERDGIFIYDFNQIIDPYGGLEDIKNKRLRAVDKNLFIEDPLRFFRVMQFISRFEFEPDNQLNEICKNMSLYDEQLSSPLAKERIFEEIKKMFLKSKKPSLGFRWLLKIDRLKEKFPELDALTKTGQRADYHPEGNVFEHTMQSLDAGAIFQNYLSDSEKFMIMVAILCHDLGKAIVTDENFSCKGHDKAGVPLAKSLLKKITDDKILIKSVCKLVLYHVYPAQLLRQDSKINAYKRLALKLAPLVTLRQLAILNLCDLRGRNSVLSEPLEGAYQERFDKFLKKIKLAEVEYGPEKPVLQGRHLIDVLSPGPEMGKLLKKAYKIQIEEGIKDLKKLKKRVLEYISSV